MTEPSAAKLSFKDFWSETVYPVIKDDFERLLRTAPTRIQDKAKTEPKEGKEKKEPIQQNLREEKACPSFSPTDGSQKNSGPCHLPSPILRRRSALLSRSWMMTMTTMMIEDGNVRKMR